MDWGWEISSGVATRKRISIAAPRKRKLSGE